ncbi:hypothetical protein VNI00_008008 [Paramarasmius palmivorus]|uniref:MYND-type domain-containing protein n=1 Tax=Paramarasmius palmivorus TaxID=297713 RepID=A0AAW0CV08_9AGAR
MGSIKPTPSTSGTHRPQKHTTTRRKPTSPIPQAKVLCHACKTRVYKHWWDIHRNQCKKLNEYVSSPDNEEKHKRVAEEIVGKWMDPKRVLGKLKDMKDKEKGMVVLPSAEQLIQRSMVADEVRRGEQVILLGETVQGA